MAKDPRLERSQDYKDNIQSWRFYLDSYESGAAYLRGNNLFQHGRETDDDFRSRKKRATPPGFARAVIRSYASLLSRARVQRDTDNEEFREFVDEDCDRRGNGLAEFVMNVVFSPSQAVGMHWVLVDKPLPEAVPTTVLEEYEQDLFPYCVSMNVDQVINWEFDDFGKLLFVTHTLPNNMNPGGKPIMRVWDRIMWSDYTEKGQLIGQGLHNLGVVPFAVCYNDRSVVDQNMGVSAIQNIAYLNREIFNLSSLLQEFLYKQCFNILALPESTAVDAQGVKTIGTSNALPVAPGEIIPTYVSPPVDPAGFLAKTIEDDIARIYQEAGLVDRSAQQVGQAQSGISRAFEFHSTNSLMAHKARGLEQFERDIADIWFAWQGIDETDYAVSYPDNFDVRDTTQLLDEAERVLKLQIKSATLKQKFALRLIPQLLPDVSPEDREAIEEEIESGGEPEGAEEKPGSIESRLARVF